jgi:hypothetical protein
MAREKPIIRGGEPTAAALVIAALIAFAAALALWALYGPLVFVNALNAAWTCF